MKSCALVKPSTVRCGGKHFELLGVSFKVVDIVERVDSAAALQAIRTKMVLLMVEMDSKIDQLRADLILTGFTIHFYYPHASNPH
jgi:formate-dependent nitrite reductase cytochrome c552 subunit